MRMIGFDFHGTTVVLEAENDLLREKLRLDFSFFESPPATNPDFKIRSTLGRIPWELLPKRKGRVRTKNSLVLDQGSVRYNDYFGQALSVCDFEKGTVTVFADSANRLHELTYLVVLSLVGKHLDHSGLHRIHAMGVAAKNVAFLCMMPMKGGKTTLFLHLLKNRELRIISDDSPIVGTRPGVKPFPVRVGILPEALDLYKGHEHIDFSRSYEIDRLRYGRKTLLPIDSLRNSVVQTETGRILLVRGKRRSGAECVIKRASFLRLYPHVFMNLVIGVGLPIMAEYFIEGRRRDFLKLSRIFFSRLKTSLRLTWGSDKFEIHFGSDHEKNSATVMELIEAYES